MVGKEVPPSADGLTSADTTASLARHTVVMSVGTALSRLTGLLRVVATAWALGLTASRLADAYNVANTTPNIVYDLVLGGVLSSTFVPVFVEWLESRGREAAWESARTVITAVTVVLVLACAAAMAAADPIIHLYTLHARPQGLAAYRALAVPFLLVFMPQLIFYGLGAVWTALLNAHRRFAAPMFAPILNNVVAIAAMATFAMLARGAHVTPATLSATERWVLAGGTTLGVIVMTVALLPALRATGFRWRPALDLHDEALRRIVRLSGWVLVYVLTSQLGYLVVIVLSNHLTGDYTVYSYAYIFFQLPFAVFVVSVFTALLPAMSSRWVERDLDGFRSLLSRGVRSMGFIILPSALGTMALAGPAVRLLFEHGRVTGVDTHLLAGTLVAFGIALLPFSAFQLFLRAFYAMQDTRTPALINLGGTAIGAVANVILYRYLGVEGLALGFAVTYAFGSVVAVALLRRRLSRVDGRRITASLARMLVAAAAAGAAALGVSSGLAAAFDGGRTLVELAQVVLGVAAGVGAFGLLAMLLGVEELSMVTELAGIGYRGRHRAR